MTRNRRIVILFVLAMISLAGCGGHKGDKHPTPTPTPTPIPSPTPTPSATSGVQNAPSTAIPGAGTVMTIK